MPIIIELLVHGGTLINFHHTDISHKALQFIRRLAIYPLQQAVRPIEIHPHESAEAQVVQRLRLHVRKALPHLNRFQRQGFGQIQILVTDKIGFLIQRIRLQIGSLVHPFPARKEDGNNTHAQTV